MASRTHTACACRKGRFAILVDRAWLGSPPHRATLQHDGRVCARAHARCVWSCVRPVLCPRCAVLMDAHDCPGKQRRAARRRKGSRDGVRKRRCTDESNVVVRKVEGCEHRVLCERPRELQAQANTHSTTRTHARTHARTHDHAHEHTRARIHTHGRTRRHTHTHSAQLPHSHASSQPQTHGA